MTFDDVLFAYPAGLEAEMAILRQVDALAVEQPPPGPATTGPPGIAGHAPRRADAQAGLDRDADSSHARRLLVDGPRRPRPATPGRSTSARERRR